MQIQQMMMQQNSMFAGNMAYAQQIGAPMQAAMGMPAPSPFSMPAYAMQGAAAPYGERLAMGAASFASNVAAPTFMGGMALAGGMGMLGRAGRIFDPFGSAISGGMAGFASGGGIAGAMGGAAMGALPGYLAMKAADVYGGAFMGGVQDQSNVNNVLRSNFRFYGGSGPMGRGFSQNQMGQIGNMLQGTARGDLTTSMGELTQLTQMGAQMGQFTGVRDVQQFGQKFKQMLSTLRTIQDELGGSLTEAMTFMRNANQNGVFRNLDSYAAQMRTAQGTTGMSMDQLNGMAMQGAGLSQMMGGRRAQGAVGALRTASSLGAALSSGVINSEALQEATGLRGAEGIQALTGRLMEHTAQFSRRAMGRYSIFGMSNARGTGLDENAVNAMMSGGMSVGDLQRTARGNVGRMGRARAINNEGLLRGALLEQGGLAGQIGIMRMAVGDRVLDQGDDYASLFMQRRMRMSRPEAELMTSLMRNQGTIAEQEALTRRGTRLETSRNREIQEHRSMDAYFAHMGHALEEGTGVSAARDAGRRFLTRMSDLSQKVMNRLLGVAESEMTAGNRAMLNRYSMGAATGSDMQRISQQLRDMGNLGGRGGGTLNLRDQGIFETGPSLRNQLNSRGLNYGDGTNVDEARARRDIMEIEDARRGVLTNQRDIRALGNLTGTEIMNAQTTARGAHERRGVSANAAFYAAIQRAGGTANAADAFMAQNGIEQFATAPTQDSLMGRMTRNANSRDRVLSSAWRMAGMGAAAGAGAGAFAGGIGAVPGALIGGVVGFAGGLFTGADRDMTPREQMIEEMASGGRLRRELEYNAEHRTVTGARRGSRGSGGVTAQNARDHRSDLDRAEGLQVDTGAMRGVIESTDFQERIQRLQGLSGSELTQELDRMSTWAMRGSTDDERRARSTAVQNLQRSAARDGGRDFARDLRSLSAASDDENEEVLRSISSRGAFLSSLGGGFATSGAYLTSVGDVRAGRANNLLGGESRGAAMQRQHDRGIQSYNEQMTRLSNMSYSDLTQELNTMRENMQGGAQRADESDEDYQRRVARVDPDRQEQFQALSREAYRRQGVTERLSGKGRRGRQGAREEAWNLLTGGNVREIRIGEGRRERSTSNRTAIMEALRRGAGGEGEESSAEFNSIVAQMHRDSGTSMTRSRYADLVRQTARAGGDIGTDLQTALMRDDPGLAKRQREALMQQQAARDPQGAQQLTELQGINRAVTRMADRGGPDAPAPGE